MRLGEIAALNVKLVLNPKIIKKMRPYKWIRKVYPLDENEVQRERSPRSDKDLGIALIVIVVLTIIIILI